MFRRESRAHYRSLRINQLAKKLTARFLSRKAKEHDKGAQSNRRPLRRKEMKRAKLRPIIAYDLETTRIAKGSPRVLYITAYCDAWSCSVAVNGLEQLRDVLTERFLVPENNGVRFVGWNANHYDTYFIGAALLHSKGYILRPYLTKGKSLRGLKVIAKRTLPGDKRPHAWEFLDGMSMCGLPGMPLKKFLSVFVPEYGKLEAPDWEREEFNSHNAAHVAYAERDSEGLYRGIVKAQSIVAEHFNIGLQPTVGNMAIKILQANIPDDVVIWRPAHHVTKIVRDYVMRGGYCYSVRKYHGPIWKYDLNQAYAAAMRDAWLPWGSCYHFGERHPHAKCQILRIEAMRPENKIPFYYRTSDTESDFGFSEIRDTWITSTEYVQLVLEGWSIKILDAYGWIEGFRLNHYVDKLENLRGAASDGPSGAQGTMVKSIGNNSYGKTVEQLEGIELLLSPECPPEFHPYQPDDETLQHIWFRFGEPLVREYHQPQIGAFITAHVRMVVRRAALVNPAAFLYADTDCVVFSECVSLPLDLKQYGMWKLEVDGENYRMITKKVYASESGAVKHAKGMNVNRLDNAAFISWYNGTAPKQTQLHRVNWLKAMTGADMFAERTKVGQKG